MAQIQTYVSGNDEGKPALVVIFLRGGADGLNLVPPLQDDGYYRARPRIAIAGREAIRLDGFFGLNPLLKELEPAYRDGLLGIVHAAGSEDGTRSHFEAQDLMEHGGLVAGGWLGRFLRYGTSAGSGPLAAVAIGKTVPECLRGAPAATVMTSVNEFALGDKSAPFLAQLSRLYGLDASELGATARDTLSAMQRLERLSRETYHPAHGAVYGEDAFAQGLKEIARLIKARVGLEAASLDLNGWDSHFSQSTVMDPLMRRLSQGLGAFLADLGPWTQSTTVVAMTEFGRRVRENSAFGTDHGRGSVMFVAGGGLKGGRVYGAWPGLTEGSLEGPGDLPVTTNYRDVLAPILRRQSAGGRLDDVFPGYPLAPLSLYS